MITTKKILVNGNGTKYLKQTKIPNIAVSEDDIYIITSAGDRLDIIAFDYYGDAEMWRVIAAANNNITKGSLYPIPGTQLRIPPDSGTVINEIEKYNS